MERLERSVVGLEEEEVDAIKNSHFEIECAKFCKQSLS